MSGNRAEIASLPLAMRDRIRLGVDVLLPPSSVAGSPVPTVMIMTRYWRSFRMSGGGRPGAPMGPRPPIADHLLERDYAVVVVDARGTGASEGVWSHPWSTDELADYREVVTWIVSQPWSNGRVAATGISYEGTTAMLLAASGHPAVRAVAARDFEFDLLPDIIAPGGIRNAAFLSAWGQAAAELDANRVPEIFGRTARIFLEGVRPVDEDPDGTRLAATVHARQNPEVGPALLGLRWREDTYADQAVTADDLSVRAHLADLQRHAVPAQIWASWMDGTTADSALALFAALPSVRDVRIAAFSHTGEHDADPLNEGGGRWTPRGALAGRRKPDPGLAGQWEQMLSFLEPRLRPSPGEADGSPGGPVREDRLIHYFTMGERRWKTTPTWPPPQTRSRTLHLASTARLLDAPAATPGGVLWDIDPRSTTGRRNRWYTQLAKPVWYGDRRRGTTGCPSWLGEALPEDLEITGHPTLQLVVACSQPDAALIAYLEAVRPAGRVHYLTEGLLRLAQRPVHGVLPTLRRADERPLEPGRPVSVELRLLPTSVLVPRGWRLRLTLAGADADTFEAPTSEQPARLRVLWGPGQPAELSLPVAPPTAGPQPD